MYVWILFQEFSNLVRQIYERTGSWPGWSESVLIFKEVIAAWMFNPGNTKGDQFDPPRFFQIFSKTPWNFSEKN